MVDDGGVDKGFVDFEYLAFDVGDTDYRKAVVKPFKIVLEQVNLHAIDERMNLGIEQVDVVLSIFERLLCHFLIYVPHVALFDGLFVCER